jgi:choline kinase
MKALILAAGYGKRLQPITNTIPKSLVEVRGMPLLVNALNHLVSLGISEIGIVTGHKKEVIMERIGSSYRGVPVSYFANDRYLTTNNVASLAQALDFCDDDMLLLECDLYYRREMLEKMMNGPGECSILVSPFDPATMDGTVIRVDGDRAAELILGAWQPEGFDYTGCCKTVNIYRFSKAFTRKYMPLIRWYVTCIGENSYYEKVLGSLIYLRDCDIRVVCVPGSMWCEIDNAEDLARAEKQFGS